MVPVAGDYGRARASTVVRHGGGRDRLGRRGRSGARNRGGLVVRVRLDRRRYPTGKKISKKELRELKVEREEFHGEWNYVIRSRMEQR